MVAKSGPIYVKTYCWKTAWNKKMLLCHLASRQSPHEHALGLRTLNGELQGVTSN